MRVKTQRHWRKEQRCMRQPRLAIHIGGETGRRETGSRSRSFTSTRERPLPAHQMWWLLQHEKADIFVDKHRRRVKLSSVMQTVPSKRGFWPAAPAFLCKTQSWVRRIPAKCQQGYFTWARGGGDLAIARVWLKHGFAGAKSAKYYFRPACCARCGLLLADARAPKVKSGFAPLAIAS